MWIGKQLTNLKLLPDLKEVISSFSPETNDKHVALDNLLLDEETLKADCFPAAQGKCSDASSSRRGCLMPGDCACERRPWWHGAQHIHRYNETWFTGSQSSLFPCRGFLKCSLSIYGSNWDRAADIFAKIKDLLFNKKRKPAPFSKTSTSNSTLYWSLQVRWTWMLLLLEHSVLHVTLTLITWGYG